MIHLIKLAVGAASVDDLAAWQKSRRAGGPKTVFHVTRFMPKRADEVLAGGSMYWVIAGFIQVRQRIVGFEPVADADGDEKCAIRLERKLVRVAPTPRRPHQGWRYLSPPDAPPDLKAGDAAGAMPPELMAELKALGLL